ncbi:MAG: CopG family transcriptional regulator [Lachnospiraceae bacterium]|nr:CopG family transcriptional regulator [Lachnospiraceae bacterium]
MSPRTGRPKVNNPKNYSIKIRFDKELHDKLEKYCRENNITRTEAVRKGINMLWDK